MRTKPVKKLCSDQLMDFAHYGYGDLQGYHITVGECALSGQKFAGQFNWTWEPMKHSKPVPE